MYVEESPGGASAIVGVATSTTAFVGYIAQGEAGKAVGISSAAAFDADFGGLDRNSPLSYAVHQFFDNGGGHALVVRAQDGNAPTIIEAMEVLRDVDLFNLLCVPDTFAMSESDAASVATAAAQLCEDRRAFYIADAPASTTLSRIVAWAETATTSRNAAVYFPAATFHDPLDGMGKRNMAPSGAIAGIYARIDQTRGVWKAPAGLDATLTGAFGLAVPLTDRDNSGINPSGINALRTFPNGHVVWGARTRRGADAQADEYKYVPVRRLALFLEESIYRGTTWALFEPNDEPLWAKLRLNIGSFMHALFRQGAFQGRAANEAWFVKCDATTTTASDISLGIVNLLVGFAPLKPAEFVVLKFHLASPLPP